MNAMSPGAGTAPLVDLRNIRKAFGGVRAVDDVSVNLYPGEVVALLGHNGAGKSTLMKMLAGAYPIDSGEVLIRGEKAHIRTPADAQALGIETIYQTLALADNLDAVANLFLGRELLTPWRTLDDLRMDADARKVFERLNKNFKNIRVPVRRLSGGQRQTVAISRALYFNARILIMDEPCAALGLRKHAWSATDQAAEGRRRGHLPHQPRHAGRVRAVRSIGSDEKRQDGRHLQHPRGHRGRGAGHDHPGQAPDGKTQAQRVQA